MILVIVASIIGALFFAIAAVIQQYQASLQAPNLNLHISLIARLIKQPIWLIGIASSFMGFIFQAVALFKGSLALVQPLLVLGVVFALPISAGFIHKRMMTLKEWIAAISVSFGLIAFLITAQAKGGARTADLKMWLYIISTTAVISAIIILVSRKMSISNRSTMQATAGGLINGLAAAFTKEVTHNLYLNYKNSHNILLALFNELHSWEFIALLVDYAIVLFLVQSAFQGNQIGWSLPALTVSNPVISLVIGVIGFKESIRTDSISIVFELLFLAISVYGIILLAKLPSYSKPIST
jgi:hypothetical protein